MSTVGPVESAAMPALADWIPERLHRFTLDEYEALVAAGVFGRKSRLHLINGCLVEKMTQNPPHSTADLLLGKHLDSLLPAGWHSRGSKPIRIPPGSMPEPDQSVVRGDAEDYADRHPEPSDVGLVVEISDSSLHVARKQSLIYAAAGIKVYWIVNINDRRIEVYTQPSAAGYAERKDYLPGQSVPVVLDGTEVGSIAGDDVLPRIRPRG